MRIARLIAGLGALVLAAQPVAAQSVGGPHKPINQIGGPKPAFNQVVANPHHTASPAVLPSHRTMGAGAKRADR